MQLEYNKIKDLVSKALSEDIGKGDITSQAVIGKGTKASFSFVTRQPIIISGVDVVKEVFRQIDKTINIKVLCSDGYKAGSGKTIIKIKGNASSILAGERVALNFIQHMSGIATYTNKFVNEVKGTGAIILDTRKTLPGLRLIEKYAVKCGGGRNHRMGLYDGILIKDNHIAICGSIRKAIELAKKKNPKKKIEIECDNLKQVKEAIYYGADVILLDNMTVDQLKKAVKLVNKKVPLEASGNVNIINVKKIAKTGVDFISIGSITHSAPNADIGLDLIP